MSSDCVNNSVLEKMINEQPKLNFNQLDNVLIKYKIPKDISKVIFSYYKPICDKCENCCSLCRFYCFYECLRKDNLDTCCNYEFNNSSRKYVLTKIINEKLDNLIIELDTDSDELIIRA